MDSVSHN